MKILIFIFLTFSFSSCDIFNIRDGEPPNQLQNVNPPATEETILIQNLNNSFRDKNTENYLTCFEESIFNFIPSSQAISQYPFLAEDWDKENERRYFSNLINEVPVDSNIVLTFTNINYNRQTDSTFFTGSYTLKVPARSPDISTIYQGEVRFTMIRSFGAVWRIYYWQDIKNSESPSWSDLKGRYYN